MNIIRTRLAEGARKARGTAVIIDVFRAFTCVPLFFHFGTELVLLEADPERAVSMKVSHPHWILAGEVDEIPIKGGDMGNSPSEILLKGRNFFRGKTVVHRTTAGVTGAISALGCADEVLLGSFLTARATARYIRGRNPETVTLVAMGSRAVEPAPEDEACAAYLEHLLNGRTYDHFTALQGILFAQSAEKFLRGNKGHLPPEDPVLCLQMDLFDMVLGAQHEGGSVAVTRKA